MKFGTATGLIAVLAVLVPLAWSDAGARNLSDDVLNDRQRDEFENVEMMVRSIPEDELDPATRPEGFDELSAALDDIDRSLDALGSTVEELPAGTSRQSSAPGDGGWTRDGGTGDGATGGGWGSAAATADTGESEPNNTFGKATPAAPNGTISGTIQPRGDYDWYLLEIAEQGQLLATTASVPADLEVMWRVWNADRSAITGWYAPRRAGGETRAVIDLREAGRYYLELHDGRDDGASSEGYAVTLEFTPSGDAAEPNNSFGTAAVIAPDASLQATILPKGDYDWFRVDVPEQGELRATIDQVPEALAIVARAWNAERHAFTGWYAPLGKGGATEAIVDLPAAGNYYLEVHDDRDDARAIEPYALSLAFTPTGDGYEPNNSFGRAAPIDTGATVQATVFPRGDADWYRIDAARQGELNIEVSNSPEELDIAVRVWNADKHAISRWYAPLTAGGDVIGKFSLPEPGSYTLEVRDGRDDARATAPYTLRLSLD